MYGYKSEKLVLPSSLVIMLGKQSDVDNVAKCGRLF